MFDLDNTLYPHHVNLWQQVDARIRDFVADYLKVTPEQAFLIQKDYYKRYGTTMRGLMTEHGLRADDYLHYVHLIDHSPLEANPPLGAAIEKLPGRKLILTNGSRDHAAQGAGAARDHAAFRGRVRHRRRRSRAEAGGAHLSQLPRQARASIRRRPRCSRTSRAISKCRMRSA